MQDVFPIFCSSADRSILRQYLEASSHHAISNEAGFKLLNSIELMQSNMASICRIIQHAADCGDCPDSDLIHDLATNRKTSGQPGAVIPGRGNQPQENGMNLSEDLDFAAWLKQHHACEETLTWAADKTLRAVWDTCERGDWLEWLLFACGYRWEPPALAEYERVKAPALAKYERVTATALAEYTRVAADTIRMLVPYPFGVISH